MHAAAVFALLVARGLWVRLLALLRPYRLWVRRYDTPAATDLERLRERALQTPQRLRIALVMPVFNTPERWLRRAIESVLEQTWPDWQLCIADDASDAPHVRAVLAEYARRDDRIRICLREDRGHISANSNSALELVDCEFVGFLDHDDELPPHALQLVSEELAAYPDTTLVYTDEDKIDTGGRRFAPHFKPDYNADYLRACNYITHLAVYRTALVRELGGLRTGYEGAQDFDLVLRYTDRVDAASIRHIPCVLYHWRTIPGSTSLALESKSYAAEAGRRAVSDHARRMHLPASARVLRGTSYRLEFEVPDPAPLVSLVICSDDAAGHLPDLLQDLLQGTRYAALEVVLAGTSLATAGAPALARDARLRSVETPAGASRTARQQLGLAAASGELLALLAGDLRVLDPDWLGTLVAQAVRPDIGVVGAKLLQPSGLVAHCGLILEPRGTAVPCSRGAGDDAEGYVFRASVAHNLTVLSDDCLMLRRSLYREAGDRLDVAAGARPALLIPQAWSPQVVG